MVSRFRPPANSDRERFSASLLQATVASSPIYARCIRAGDGVVPDWQNARKSPDVDALVLAWIASHTKGAHRGSLH